MHGYFRLLFLLPFLVASNAVAASRCVGDTFTVATVNTWWEDHEVVERQEHVSDVFKKLRTKYPDLLPDVIAVQEAWWYKSWPMRIDSESE